MEDDLSVLRTIVDDLKNAAPWQLERISAYIKSLGPFPEVRPGDKLSPSRQASPLKHLSNVKRFLEALPNCVLLSDSQGVMVALSPVSEKLLGYPRSELIGKPIDCLSIGAFQAIREKFWSQTNHDHAGGMPPVVSDLIVQRGDGSAFAAQSALSSIQTHEGIFLLTTVTDISERRSIEEALRHSERRFRDLTDALPNLVWQLSPEGDTTYANKRWQDYFQRSPILPYERRVDLIHPDDLPAVRDVWMNSAGSEVVGPWEVRYRRYDGVYRWFSTRGIAIHDENGKLLSWIGTATDINDLKMAEESLRVSAERLSLALDAGMIGVWDFNLLTGELSWDTRCRAAFGLSSDIPVTYDTFLAGLHPDDRERMDKAVRSVINSKGSDQLIADCRVIGLEDGVLRHLLVKWHALFEQRGRKRRAVRFIGTVHDITQRKQAEEALRRANLDLQQFAYAAAHDLQEPLRNVATAMGLLKRNHGTCLNEAALTLVETGVEGAKRMHHMVTDLLAFTTVVQDTFNTKALVDANQVLHQALNNLATGDAEITTSSLPIIPVAETHLVQLFQNIIGNALKYRRSDVPLRIRVRANRQAAEYVFSVADNGIGFDQQHAKRIFGVFKRLHHQDEYPGTGIGLAICCRIVESYGGRIWAEARPGEGATIFFSLPAERHEPD